MTLTIVGLGAGRWEQLTGEARAALEAASAVWLPPAGLTCAAGLPAHVVAREIAPAGAAEGVAARHALAEALMDVAQGPGGTVYATPGHPLLDDPAVPLLLRIAAERDTRPRVVPGLSLIDLALAHPDLPPTDGQIQTGFAWDLRSDPARPLLIRRIGDPGAAAAALAALSDEYPADHPVTLLRLDRPPDPGSAIQVPLADLDRRDGLGPLACAYLPAIPADRDVRTFAATRRIIGRLRAPGGCPWDREQTPETLKPYVIEEAYEVVEAIDAGDPAKLAEELGDLLLQVVLHAQIAAETGAFTLTDVIEAINTKLIRRHPHVFGDLQVRDAREVLANWEVLKERERAPASSLLEGLPAQLPALAYAQTLQRKLARFGLKTAWDPVFAARLVADLDALEAAPGPPGRADRTRRLALLLWRIGALAGSHEIDLEDALRTLSRSVVEDFRRAEAEAAGDREAIARVARPAWEELTGAIEGRSGGLAAETAG